MATERMLTVVLPDGTELDVVLEAPDIAPVALVSRRLGQWCGLASGTEPLFLDDATELPLDAMLADVPVRPGTRLWLGAPPADPERSHLTPQAIHRALVKKGLAEPRDGGTLYVSRRRDEVDGAKPERSGWRRLLPGRRRGQRTPPGHAQRAMNPRWLLTDTAELWHRAPQDEEFLRIELGYLFNHNEEIRYEPVTVDLPGIGVLGVVEWHAAGQVGAWLVAHVLATHSPADVDVRVLTSDRQRDVWDFLRLLPDTPAGPRVSYDAGSSARHIADLLSRGSARPGTPRPTAAVLVLDGARDLRTLPGVTELLQRGPEYGVFVICLESTDRLGPECRVVFDADPSSPLLQKGGRLYEGWHVHWADRAQTDRLARILAPLRAPTVSAEPDSPRLLDLLDLPLFEMDVQRRRWARPSHGLSAPIGESQGVPVAIDLVRDGPHALVAGTTGSGKTEFLRTWIASMAANHPPDALSFVLVDYKGGGAFADCARLPHTVDVIVDFDTYLVERTLIGLAAELRRRSELLTRTGVRDIGDYADLFRAGDVRAPEPLPRMVLVVDEFASLTREFPDFISGLVDIARRGRSLGVHLVLATQRPGGVVTPAIRANTNLRIALRLVDRNESTDVIDEPDAAWLGKSEPGAAYVRTGAETLVRLRTARVGIRHAPEPEHWSDVRVRDAHGDPEDSGSLRVESEPAGMTDLTSLVDQLDAAATVLGIPRPPAFLPPPLADVIRLGAPLAETDLPEHGRDRMPVPIGLADMPENRFQTVATLDLATMPLLAAGGPRSGRSQLLRTVAGSVARQHSSADVHLYGIDCGTGALQALTELPHCGAVVSRNERDRLTRLLDRLTTTVRVRQSELAAGAFADVPAQRQAVASHLRLPYLLVFVDGWEGFTDAMQDVDYGKPVDDFLRLCREGPRVGVCPVVVGGPQVLHGRIRAAAANLLVLRQADETDYLDAGIRTWLVPGRMPPGRVLYAEGRDVVQIALLPGGAETARGQAEALARIGAAARQRDAGVPSTRRPFRVDALDLAADRFHVGGGTGRPVGREAELAWLRDRYATGTSVALLGPRRAGKTWVLGELERRLVADGAGQVRKLTVPHRASPVDSSDQLAALLDPAVRGATSPAEALLTRAADRAARADREAFLLDEVGRLAEYHPAAVSWLRDLGQAGAWLVYTGTEKDWQTVVRSALTAPGSSFGNDVDKRILGPLGEPHALAFLTGTAANLGVDIAPDRAGARILALVGTWPFYLQVMGDAVVRAVQADDRRPLTSGPALEELCRQELLIGRSEQFQSRWAEIGPAGRAALLHTPGAPPPEPAPAQRMELRDVGLLRPGDVWLADRPFFDWIALSQVSLRDESLRGGGRREPPGEEPRAEGPRTDEEQAP
ncbi:FtsK/SpoIIIE domain-containing protein [Streptomyces sp. NBC_01808]|uniref:FtsK/SpoIIIE domain-containing protein n=1 Tax=Streptomyces sp. NBC_01808 TaxID=2975947 RepID=UPI002DDB804B|nr:FtsK/SpoIIIE domain-containing protein [Streptomyces sp. NBC_01808]WSA37681.1 FtsK/SpoIIIE domain-containing protein [Streptomyces sp. NBC_01808]